MTRPRVVVLVAAAVVAGCGGGNGHDAATTTTAAPRQVDTEKVQPPTLGCDVVVVCVPQVAHDVLARCPAKRLNADGRHARKRLENFLEHIDDVDLHNRQAYEADDAAQYALTQLEAACSG